MSDSATDVATAAEAVRRTVCDITKTYGSGITQDPRLCEALLRDLCGHYKREINVLVTALKERVAVDLSQSGQELAYASVRRRLAQRLYDSQAVELRFGSWAVDVWALALGQITDAEYQSWVSRPFVERKESPATPPVSPRQNPIDELRAAIQAALADDVVTLDEQRSLKELSRRLRVPSQVANQVLAEVVMERKTTK